MRACRFILPVLAILASAFIVADVNADGPERKSRRILVIPVEFQDLAFTYSRQTIHDFINGEDFIFEGACGSVKRYLDDQFGQNAGLILDICPTVTLSQNHSFYGGNDDKGADINAAELVREACLAVDEQIDFAAYDNNADGCVQHLVILFAGPDESDGAGEEYLWSECHSLSDSRKSFTLDGVGIDLFACASELWTDAEGNSRLAGIGRFCHELLHTFGLKDMYDSDRSGNKAYWSAGLWGSTSIMDEGYLNNSGHTPPNLNAIEREMLGIGEALTDTIGRVSVKPVQEGEWLRFNSDVEGEYYLAEYRNGEGWDRYIGGHGMLIYHIDRSENSTGEVSGREMSAARRWQKNYVNANPQHQCADLIEASGAEDRIWRTETLDKSLLPGLFFPEGSSTFGPFTTPEFSFWSGGKAKISLSAFSEAGPARFDLRIGGYSTEISSEMLFQNAAIIFWTCESDAPCNVKLNGETIARDLHPQSDCNFAILASGLEPGSRNVLQITDGDGFTLEHEFHTRSLPDPCIGHINTEYFELREDGFIKIGSRIPLVVDGCPGCKVEWYADGRWLTPAKDGMITLERSFSLKAKVIRENGAYLNIIKEIKVK